jgi:hypothetical protein
MKDGMSIARLKLQNLLHRGTGGRSEENRDLGFRPAFLDFATQRIYPSCFRNGLPAAIHVLDGVPKDVAMKPTLIAGFVRNGYFYTRRAAAKLSQA